MNTQTEKPNAATLIEMIKQAIQNLVGEREAAVVAMASLEARINEIDGELAALHYEGPPPKPRAPRSDRGKKRKGKVIPPDLNAVTNSPLPLLDAQGDRVPPIATERVIGDLRR